MSTTQNKNGSCSFTKVIDTQIGGICFSVMDKQDFISSSSKTSSIFISVLTTSGKQQKKRTQILHIETE